MNPWPLRIAIFTAALLAALIAVWALRLTQTPTAAGGVAAIGGPFALVDHNGRAVTDADFRGRVMLVFFGFTHCPDVCPTELTHMTLALDELSERERAQVAALFITVDPARDTPAALKEYLVNFHPGILGLSGSAEQVAAVIRTYRVYAARSSGAEGDNYLMDHSAFTYVMDRQGRYASHLRPGAAAEEIVARVRQTL